VLPQAVAMAFPQLTGPIPEERIPTQKQKMQSTLQSIEDIEIAQGHFSPSAT
jgi:hypothetical protein